MGFSDLILWAGLSWLVLFAIVFTAVILARPPRRADKVAKNVGLPLPVELRPLASSLQRGDYIGAATSSGVGVIAACGLLLAVHADSFAEILGGYLLVIMVAVGIGTTVTVLRRERKRQEASVRLARMRAVSLSDYETWLRIWGPRVAVALLTAGLIVRVATTPHLLEVPAILVVYVLATVATLTITEIAARRIISRGQPAGSEIELAWDDAIKSRALYTLGIAPLFLGSYGGLLLNILDIGIHARGAQAAGLAIEAALGMMGIVVNLVVQVGDLASNPQQRYLRRLWPELAAANAADRVAVPRPRVQAVP